MAGFFSDIQSLYDAKYGGRHLAFALKALARHEMDSFQHILTFAATSRGLSPKCKAALSARNKDSTEVVDTEYLYGGKNGGLRSKRADLVLLKDDQPRVLFEIKDEDQKSAANLEQLRRYVDWCRQTDTPLIHVSRYPLEGEDRDYLLENSNVIASLSYGDVHTSLEKVRTSPLAHMIREYLEDLGAMRYRKLDLSKKSRDYASLKFWARRFLDVTLVNAGKNRTDRSIESFPAHLACLFGNLEFFGSRIREANPKLIRQRFSREFKRELNPPTRQTVPQLVSWAKRVGGVTEKLVAAKHGTAEQDKLAEQLAHVLRHGPDERYLSFHAYALLHPPGKKRLSTTDNVCIWLEYYLVKEGEGDILLGHSVGIDCPRHGVEEEDFHDYNRQFPEEAVAWRSIKASIQKLQKRALARMPSGKQKDALGGLALS